MSAQTIDFCQQETSSVMAAAWNVGILEANENYWKEFPTWYLLFFMNMGKPMDERSQDEFYCLTHCRINSAAGDCLSSCKIDEPFNMTQAVCRSRNLPFYHAFRIIGYNILTRNLLPRFRKLIRNKLIIDVDHQTLTQSRIYFERPGYHYFWGVQNPLHITI